MKKRRTIGCRWYRTGGGQLNRLHPHGIETKTQIKFGAETAALHKDAVDADFCLRNVLQSRICFDAQQSLYGECDAACAGNLFTAAAEVQADRQMKLCIESAALSGMERADREVL